VELGGNDTEQGILEESQSIGVGCSDGTLGARSQLSKGAGRSKGVVVKRPQGSKRAKEDQLQVIVSFQSP